MMLLDLPLANLSIFTVIVIELPGVSTVTAPAAANTVLIA